jgi:deazaflavin-dependent oxidoreductase (nitroreductase family)
MARISDWNRAIVEEFRTNEGRVRGPFDGRPLLLLHHFGARSGLERVNPLAYQRIGGSFAVFASKGGAPTNPDWFYNLRANPGARIEVGTKTIDVVARIPDQEERDRIWEEQKRLMPAFADYERRTPRQIPVVVLDPGNPGGPPEC